MSNGRGFDIARVKQKAVEKGILRPEDASTLSDCEALKLIFRSDVSTPKAATAVSGQRAGLALVKFHIEEIRGIIEVSSLAGQGTTVKLRIPLTPSTAPAQTTSPAVATFRQM